MKVMMMMFQMMSCCCFSDNNEISHPLPSDKVWKGQTAQAQISNDGGYEYSQDNGNDSFTTAMMIVMMTD